MKFDLQRMRTWLSALGNPQNNFPCVHVAGTNGKGSVVSCINQILIQNGLRVGMYTSPHLEHVNERFQINNQAIRDKEFKNLARQIQSIAKNATEFEFLTLLGFLWFSNKKVDVLVLEVGLGGRLDATNVVQHVLASVITHIDLEHTEWLGATVAKIAAEKAGIIKPNVPVLTMASGDALKVISSIAKNKNAPLSVVAPSPKKWPISLQGHHQQNNATLAVQTIRTISEYIPKWRPSSIHSGLRRVSWPGRFEIFKGVPPVILDGAHNSDATQALISTLQEKKIRKVKLIFGVLKDKSFTDMALMLAPHVKRGFVVPVSSNRSSHPSAIARLKPWENRMIPINNLKTAFQNLEGDGDSVPILVTGSLYLVGEARTFLKQRRKISR